MGSVNDVRRLCASGDIVGECPVWDDRARRLLWVDIAGKRIHCLDPQSGDRASWPTPEIVTFIGLCEGEGAIVGLRKTVTLWNFGDAFTNLAVMEPELEGNRLNDARVAPDGCLWLGTMQNNLTGSGAEKPITGSTGAFHKVHPNGEVESLGIGGFGICNTLAWTEGGYFICADTTANSLFRFRYDNGHVTEGRRFGEPFERGLPDGSALDSEGYLWNCRVGGGCIVRFDPDGAVDRVIDLPCSAPTSCAFGGDDMRTLFITSARFGLDANRRDHPDEGALFALRPGPRGLPEHRFGSPALAAGSPGIARSPAANQGRS